MHQRKSFVHDTISLRRHDVVLLVETERVRVQSVNQHTIADLRKLNQILKRDDQNYFDAVDKRMITKIRGSDLMRRNGSAGTEVRAHVAGNLVLKSLMVVP